VKISRAVVLLGFLLSSGVAVAQSGFVAPSDFDGADMLRSPPADNSAAAKADLATLHQIQNARTPASIAHARIDAGERTLLIFADLLGPRFTAANLPLTFALSQDIAADEKRDGESLKLVYPRTRPYILDKTIVLVCPPSKHDNDSYPSGHTMSGYLEGLLLASMLPEKRDAIIARADDFAHSRLVCGDHNPSDVEAGRLVAYALFATIAQVPRFKAERAAAEIELRKVLGLPARTK
jgi:acid phosphatase (class A)